MGVDNIYRTEEKAKRRKKKPTTPERSAVLDGNKATIWGFTAESQLQAKLKAFFFPFAPILRQKISAN